MTFPIKRQRVQKTLCIKFGKIERFIIILDCTIKHLIKFVKRLNILYFKIVVLQKVLTTTSRHQMSLGDLSQISIKGDISETS